MILNITPNLHKRLMLKITKFIARMGFWNMIIKV